MPVTSDEKSEWSIVRGLVAQFEANWRGEIRPKIDDYLSESGVHRGKVVVELVHSDLEFRLKAGEPARVEEYQLCYPEELATDRESLVDLIVTEWSIRRRMGSEPDDNEYQARFPRLFQAFLESREHRSITPLEHLPLDKFRTSMIPSADPLIPLPSLFGRFELRELVGKGSFGLVYRAWDATMNRPVAVKIPRKGALSSAEDTQTFLREARIASTLSHPSIVPLYDTSTHEKTPYIVSQYIDGRTLSDALKEGPLPFATSAELMATVLDALHYAHEHPKRVIHRDLKPSNILLDERDRPYLTDFGLAQREGGDSSAIFLAETGLIGTLAYMSPEQIRGSGRLGPTSDIFSAGVVLYEMLTGELPFRGRGRMLESQILEDDPLPPTRLNDAVPSPLQAICLKALSKNPDDRYPSAQAFCDDLRRYLNDEPIEQPIGESRWASIIDRAWRHVVAHPVRSLVVAYLVLAGTVGIPVLLYALWHAYRW